LKPVYQIEPLPFEKGFKSLCIPCSPMLLNSQVLNKARKVEASCLSRSQLWEGVCVKCVCHLIKATSILPVESKMAFRHQTHSNLRKEYLEWHFEQIDYGGF